jgi:glycyl-tRNA synthetase beta chain
MNAAAGHATLAKRDTVVDSVRDYMFERLRAWYGDAGIAVECFLAVQARNVTQTAGFRSARARRREFAALPEAAALAAANKRVANILAKQAPAIFPLQIDSALLHEAG